METVPVPPGSPSLVEQHAPPPKSHAEPEPASRLRSAWMPRNLLSSARAFSPFGSRRAPEDPFLHAPKRAVPADPAPANAASQDAMLTGRTQLPPSPRPPDERRIGVVPGLTDPFGVPQDRDDPLSIAGHGHQAGELELTGESQGRLLAAIEADRRAATVPSSDSTAARRRVEALMAQARTALEEGRLAAAFKSAQSAEILANESSVVLEDGRQQPAELVRELREKIHDDIRTTTELPPEESVASGDAPPPKLELAAEPTVAAPADSASDGPLLAQSPTVRTQFRKETPGNPFNESPPPTPAAGNVELLPASPEPDEPELAAEQADLANPPMQRPVLSRARIEIVGESSSITGPRLQELTSVPAEVIAAARPARDAAPEVVAMLDSPQPFWSEREPGDDASRLDGEAGSDGAANRAAPVVAKNVDWAEIPEAVKRSSASSLPKPLLTGLGVGAAWLVGFAGLRGVRAVRGRRR